MPAAEYNFNIEKGTAFVISFEYKDDNELPINLTNWCARLRWKDNNDSIVTFNSIASVEAVSMGVPAVVLGPNAGSYLSEKDLRNIDKPYYPNIEDLFDHLDYLKWCQFTGEEMRLDYTHKVIEALQGDEKPLKFKISEDFNV